MYEGLCGCLPWAGAGQDSLAPLAVLGRGSGGVVWQVSDGQGRPMRMWRHQPSLGHGQDRHIGVERS